MKSTLGIPLRLEPWTLVQIVAAPSIIDNLAAIFSFALVFTHFHSFRLPSMLP